MESYRLVELSFYVVGTELFYVWESFNADFAINLSQVCQRPCFNSKIISQKVLLVSCLPQSSFFVSLWLWLLSFSVQLSVNMTPGKIRCSKRGVVLSRAEERVSTCDGERGLYQYFSSVQGLGGFQDCHIYPHSYTDVRAFRSNLGFILCLAQGHFRLLISGRLSEESINKMATTKQK